MNLSSSTDLESELIRLPDPGDFLSLEESRRLMLKKENWRKRKSRSEIEDFSQFSLCA